MTAPIIHWFQQDLRLADNPALNAAAATGAPVIPIYILDDRMAGDWAMGGASRWWLHHSLAALAGRLESAGSRLILRRGAASDILPQLARDIGAEAVHAARRYELAAARLEADLKTRLEAHGVDFRRFRSALLLEPEDVATKDGGPYKVFTPFYKACLDRIAREPALRPPPRLTQPDIWPEGERLDDWNLLPSAPDWAGGLRETWSPGEAGALDRLDEFVDRVMSAYGDGRDRPGRPGTSRLSPHLHFGEVSPRQVWQRVGHAVAADPTADSGAQTFLRELIWREFSYHLLHHFPGLTEAPFRPEFEAFSWRDDPAALEAWQRGRTGYPFVDAGMRELWHTGWMHNRVRMVAASFLVKHLLIPWQAGAVWFWDTLVDADLANNSASWQWVAGSGADAAPYFRIFNPVTQSEKFDPDGAYVRKWVPELARLPDKFLHRPWTAPADTLRQAGVALGADYPEPIVDHAAARRRALDAFEQVRKRG